MLLYYIEYCDLFDRLIGTFDELFPPKCTLHRMILTKHIALDFIRPNKREREEQRKRQRVVENSDTE